MLTAHEELVYAAADSISAIGTSPINRDSPTYVRNRRLLSGYNPESLYRLIQETTNGDLRNLALVLSNSELDEETTNDWCVLAPFFAAAGLRVGQCGVYINALPHYEDLAPQDNGKYTGQRLAQAIAIFKVTHHLDSNGVSTKTVPAGKDNSIHFIPDEKLRALLTTSTDPRFVSDIIIERGLIQADEITAVIDSMNDVYGSIRSGAL